MKSLKLAVVLVSLTNISAAHAQAAFLAPERKPVTIGWIGVYGGAMHVYRKCIQEGHPSDVCAGPLSALKMGLEWWNECLDRIPGQLTTLPWPDSLEEDWYVAQLAYRAELVEESFGSLKCEVVPATCLPGEKPLVCR
jgi:hypothetical protein